ncbi:hypothetical protein DQ04_07921010 [Trypanosoma grayi]|uniref:hypothetical protein n=1 Tax=Trypanosoma grayi TaxID=71804 RepID=UPI0004F4BA32|nr:hypothetical protein DQ04_07921010 [Trypanosoma grayi]KEG08138.1 hypothetical protein DQ04_07921010 [Trypanosoma grayi]
MRMTSMSPTQRESPLKQSRQQNSASLSRRLVEDYHRSVAYSIGELPSHRTFSDRYGNLKGAPVATRRDGSPKGVTAAAAAAAAASGTASDPLQWYFDRADTEEAAGKLRDAQKFLQAALEQLQRSESSPTGSTMNTMSSSEKKAEQDRVRAAAILIRLGKLSMRQNEHQEALDFFTLSSHIDPLATDTYALRGACHEYLENHAAAYKEYEKYLSLSPPTMAVLAHTSQCALKADRYEAAERHLHDLLLLTKGASASVSLSPSSHSNRFDSPSFYEAHAYYCLGLVKDKQAAAISETSVRFSKAEELMHEARTLYERAASNSAYVCAHEDAAESAMAVQDASLALENLRHLQHLRKSCAQYYSRAADVYAMINDTSSEVEELSKALDQRQSVLERRQTLLRRAAVYAIKLQNLDNAIVDLSLLLSLPGDDHCTAMAYLQRARAFQQRSYERSQSSREDVAAALRDYDDFVEAALRRPEELPAPPECITEAMLILANGAFEEKNYGRAAHFFARAVARGWQPKEPLPQARRQPKKASKASPCSLYMQQTEMNLLAKMYVAIAHTVIDHFPIVDEMFKVPYEQREKPFLPVVPESKKSKAAERKEAEKPLVAVPVVGYQVVEEQYQRLRALEPTVFSSLQYELLELWEPYRTEVERMREDLMLTRSGKKVKRR